MEPSSNLITVELTAQECDFIVNLVAQLSVSPAAKDAAQIVSLVQTLLAKFPVKK
jgi:hypothetical protein